MNRNRLLHVDSHTSLASSTPSRGSPTGKEAAFLPSASRRLTSNLGSAGTPSIRPVIVSSAPVISPKAERKRDRERALPLVQSVAAVAAEPPRQQLTQQQLQQAAIALYSVPGAIYDSDREDSVVSELRSTPSPVPTHRASVEDKIEEPPQQAQLLPQKPPRSWADESFSDWTVEVGDRVYKLHKMVVVGKSR
jgi:hypothetical protein